MIAVIACTFLTAGVLLYIFGAAEAGDAGTEKTRLSYLQERKDAVYENLRDLNFEYKAGKFPENDYESMRTSLEEEAAGILAEMERLETASAK